MYNSAVIIIFKPCTIQYHVQYTSILPYVLYDVQYSNCMCSIISLFIIFTFHYYYYYHVQLHSLSGAIQPSNSTANITVN